jgi:hypothetical protein
LAPVDIAPTIFSKYRYVDPSAGEVPANHYIIDQLTYDLPLQYTIYGAYRRGEIPWWDPYDYAGRPLLADAHVNGTDPIRIICYLTLPFVSAYNWNLILKSILTGLGMFLLLRHLHFVFSISLPLALTFQFAGCFPEIFRKFDKNRRKRRRVKPFAAYQRQFFLFSRVVLFFTAHQLPQLPSAPPRWRRRTCQGNTGLADSGS